MNELNINAARLWNLDGKRGTPGGNTNGNSRSRCYLRRQGNRDVRIPDFRRKGSETMMPVLNADWETGPVLFFFEELVFLTELSY